MSEEDISQMRKTIERLSKDKAELGTEVKDLSTQVQEYKAREVFSGEGYNPANGNLFVAMNPEKEVTAEVATDFAKAQGLILLESNQKSDDDAGKSTTEVEDGSKELAGMAGSGSGAGDGGAGGATVESLTRAQWQDLYRSDPAAAKAAVASGRVEISKDNPWVPNKVSTPGVNPYAALTETKS